MMQFLALMVLVLAAVGAFYVLARPHWAFVLVITLFPVKQLLQVYVPAVGNSPILANFLIGGMVIAAWITRMIRRERVASGYKNPVTTMILTLYALWIAGILWSPSRDVYLSYLPTDLIYQVLLLIVLPMLVLDIYEFRRMLYGLMVVGSIIALLIIVNPNSVYYSGRLVLDLGMHGSAKDMGSPLATASMGATVALMAAMIYPARATYMVTLLRIGAFICGMGIAIGSGSRGQVLAASLVGVAFYPISRKLANPKQFFVVITGFLVLVAGVYGVFKLFVGDQNVERWDPYGMLRDTTLRLNMAFDLFGHYLSSPAHWVFGLGTGYYTSISTESVARDYVHNIAAEVLCEHGVAGAALFVGMMFVLIKAAYRVWSIYREDPVQRATIAILCSLCVYSLLESLKQGSMQYPAPFFWWIVLAKLAYHETRQHAALVQEMELMDADEYATADGQDAWADQLHEPQQPGYAMGE